MGLSKCVEMGFPKADDTFLKSASRRLFEMSKSNPAYRQYLALLKSREVAVNVPAKCITPPAEPEETFSSSEDMNFSGCPAMSCIGNGVVDLLLRRPKLFKFKEACAILSHVNVARNREFIEDYIRKYAIIIVGLPDWPEEDIPLAVYFFIEDMFGVQANMEVCVKTKAKINSKDFPRNVIGVVFDSIMSKKEIAKKLSILQDSGIEIHTESFDINWIVDELYVEEKDASKKNSK